MLQPHAFSSLPIISPLGLLCLRADYFQDVCNANVHKVYVMEMYTFDKHRNEQNLRRELHRQRGSVQIAASGFSSCFDIFIFCSDLSTCMHTFMRVRVCLHIYE